MIRARRWHGAKGTQGARTHRRAAQVKRGVRSRGHAARFNRGRTLLTRIAGRVRHATRGSVVITIERLGKRHWRLARRVSLPLNTAGRFVKLMGLSAATKYRVSATYTGTAGYRPSWSGFRLISLRGR